jgi:hypothetical protein
MATPAYQFKTQLAEYFNANYTPRLHNMQDIPPLKTAADIVRENPAITMDALIAQLIDMLKDHPLSVAVKEKLFIEEFFTTGILQLKPRKMTPKLIEDRLKEIFDDPLGKLTTKKLDRLRILEFVISFAEANADEKETFVELLKQVVDVLSNSTNPKHRNSKFLKFLNKLNFGAYTLENDQLVKHPEKIETFRAVETQRRNDDLL